MSSLTVSNQFLPTTAAEPLIKLEDVSVRYRAPQERIPSIKEYAIRWLKRQITYRSFLALKEINLEIFPGESVGIIGPNGAGKSTLLKTVARVLVPTTGRVFVRGRISPLLELGAGFDPELTGRENIYLNGTILGHSRETIDRHFDEILEFSGLQGFIDSPVRTYSTGMYARLGFSVATFVRPEILIVDEILGVGDADFQKRSYERILGFQAEGSTILLVSHSLDAVQRFCSRVIWLDQGLIRASGNNEYVINKYQEHLQNIEERRLSDKIDEMPEWRWGTRSIEIVNVRFTDENNQKKFNYETGDPFYIHLDYLAHEDIPSPVFGIAIYRQDGIHITGPNTQLAGLSVPDITGSGSVTFCIPRLPLLEGLYHVSVAIHNQEDTEMYDFHDHAYAFRVTNAPNSNIKEKYGIITLQGIWQIKPSDGSG